MALAIARHEAGRIGLDLAVDSAGTLMIEDRPADPHAIAVCADLGIDLNDHRSKGLKQSHIDWAHHILVMSPHHAHFIEKHFLFGKDRVILMGHLLGQMEIPDPVGSWRRTFRQNRDMISKSLGYFLDQLKPR